jgi:hypothetical protein
MAFLDGEPSIRLRPEIIPRMLATPSIRETEREPS